MKNLLSVFLMLLLVIVTACKKGPENKTQVEVIDGVTHIHNSESPLYPERTVIFEEELSIGGEDEARIWSDIRPGLFANGKMYHMKTDKESGYRTLKRYRIIWKDKSH